MISFTEIRKSFMEAFMQKALSLLLLTVFFFSSCASAPHSGNEAPKPRPFVTPWEYYQKSRPAVLTSQDEVRVQKAEVHSTGEDTSSDKTQMIIIGVLVGVVVIGGTVAGILLTQ
jgi:hypothetical protein